MKIKNAGMAGWMVRLMLIIGLVMVMSGMALAWDMTATSITNTTGKHGRMHFTWVDQYNNPVAGGSLPDGATSGTIRGVPSGNYTLNAFIDTQGTGFQHANDPYLSYPIPVSGNNGGPVVFSDPAPVATAAPDPAQGHFDVMPLDSAAFVMFKPDKSNNLPTADRHTIYWSTSNNPGPDQTTGGSLVVSTKEPKVVIYNLTNGTSYYFAIRAENSVNTSLSAVTGPITPVAPTATASTVNVPVDTTGITKNNPLTPLIVALSDNNNSTFFSYVKTPADIQTVPVTGVKAGLYKIYVILDLSGTGNLDDPANVANMNETDRNQRALPVMVDGVSATVTAPTTRLAVKNAAVAVSTSHSRQNGSDSYNLSFNVTPMSKKLFNVTLESGPQISGPIDMGLSSDNGKNGGYSLSPQVPNRPSVGDLYHFTLYYSDNSSESRTAAVTAVLDLFPNNMFPVGSTGPGSVSPTFGWTNPGNLPGFVTTGLNMNNNGFDFLPMNLLSIVPEGASFPVGQTYNWDRSVQDLDGNQARQSMTFTPNASGPVISDFNPKSAAAGASVIITGSGFDSTPGNNAVSFNGSSATVTSASPTSLTVNAPASSGVITVTVGGVTAGSSAAFAGTSTFSGSAQDNTGANLSGVGIALVENPTVGIGSSDSTTPGNNFTNIPVPARPYFSLVFNKSGTYPTYTALMSITAPNNGNWSVFTSGDLSGRSVLPTTGKGVIIGMVQDWTNGSSANLAGAVVTATSLIHPDVPYTVKYTNTASNVAQDPASFTNTAASGPGFGLFYVVDVEEGDYVTVTASKTNMGFINRVFNTHGDSVSSQSVRGALPGTPSASPAGGSYATAQNVTLSSTTPSTDNIFYTTDGSDPSVFGAQYNSSPNTPILISADTTLKFVTKNKTINQAVSAVQTQVYTIGAGIAGHVSDANTSAPLQFVNVQLYDQNGFTLNSTNTDSSGNYQFSGLSANTYKVCFYPNQGYTSQCWQNTTSNPATATAIAVTSSHVTGINAALQTGATITGRVSRDGINGIQNVMVQLRDINGNWVPNINSTNTDQNGNYTLSGIPNGTYKLYFDGSQFGYIGQWYNGANTFDVTAGNTYPGFNAQLALGATITGRVTSNGTNGIQNIMVQLRDNTGNWIPNMNSPMTDQNGNYTLGGIPSGTYKLYFDGSQSGNVGQWYNGANTFVVTAGVTYPNFNAQLAQGATITGRVTSNGTNGIQNIMVQLRDSNGNWLPNMNSPMTDQNGNYTLGGIPSGTYKLYFDGSQSGYVGQWYNGANTFVVSAGVTYPNFNAQLSQGATITGRVTSNGTNGIQNISVQLRDSSGNGIPGINGAMTDPSGNYILGGIPSGSYKLYFDGQFTGYIGQYYNGGTPFSVTAGNTYSGFNAQLSQGATISGTVTNGASGIQNVSVQLYDSTGSMTLFNTNTDPSGGYQFSGLQAGTYRVCFSPGQTNYIARCYNNQAYNSSTATDITVSVPGGNNAVNATLTLGGGISGQVTNGNGGIQNISVEVRDSLTGNFIPGVFGMWTDLNGNYDIHGIPAGSYKVYFNPNGTGYASQWYNNKTSFAGSDNVFISAGMTTSPVSAILQPATTPGAPTIDSITPGNGWAQVNFTPPASDGGLPIFNYTVTANPGNLSNSSSGSPIYMSGLTNGQVYTISVTAKNNLGNGAAATKTYALPLFVDTFADLQAAVAVTSDGGAVWTQSGQAFLSLPPLMLTKGITISGGYDGSYSTVNGYTNIPGRVNIKGTGFKVIFKNVKVKAP